MLASAVGMLFGWETVMTFVLVSVVYAVAIGEPSFGVMGPFAVGLALFAMVFAGKPSQPKPSQPNPLCALCASQAVPSSLLKYNFTVSQHGKTNNASTWQLICAVYCRLVIVALGVW